MLASRPMKWSTKAGVLALCVAIVVSACLARAWLQVGFATLGVSLLANAVLSFYAFAHDIRYSPYHDAFHVLRRTLVAIVLILICTVLPAKKKPGASSAGAKQS